MKSDCIRRGRSSRGKPISHYSLSRPLRVERLEDRRLLAAVITVNSTADSNARDAILTLREAILVNNRTLAPATLTAAEQVQVVGAPTNADADSIRFSIAGAGLHTISPTTALPTISDPVSIDGYTQPGASANSNSPTQPLNTVLQIELAGNLAGAGAHGLLLGAGSGGSTIRGLAVNRFAGDGIRIESSGNTIAGNFIGTNAAGTAIAGNVTNGIHIVSAATNTIGGVTSAAANLISGNVAGGVTIINAPSTGNVIQGNRIGTDAAGVADLGNAFTGVLVFQASGTLIGGTAVGAGNLIAGNTNHGIWLLNNANNTVIQGNTIGTNLAGNAPLGNNGAGILVEGSLNAQIGGAALGAGNLISAGSNYGINLISNSNDATIKGNLLGTDRTGTQPLGNGYRGISVTDSLRVTIGGLAPGEGNVIAKSGESAIIIQNGTGHMILGNKIGTDASGTLNLGNTGGVNLSGLNNSVVKGNVIAFNNFGLSISGNTFGAPETGILISQNSIHSNLDSIQLDLVDPFTPIGPNVPQDATDNDTGVNNVQNFPMITSVTNLGGATRVTGTFTSRLNSNYRLEFFASGAPAGSGYGPGQTFLGDLDLSIGAGGNTVPFSIDLPALPSGQPYVTATATDITIAGGGPRNDTSEFSPAVWIDTVFNVTSTANSGGGTLREALGAANFAPGPQTISFNIPANDPRHVYYKNDGVAGQVTRANIATTSSANDASILDIDPDWAHSWFSIELESQLFINDQTLIDGYTQPGTMANTNAVGQGLNSVLRIEINGAGVHNIPQLDGLIDVATSNSTLRGLVVNRADGQAIQLRSGTGNTIAGNYIGTDASGMLGFGAHPGFEPAYAGVGVDDNPASPLTGHHIGGVTPAARNLISGSAAGIGFFDSAPNNFVEGNLIGTNRAGTQAVGNRVGIWIEAVGVAVGGAAAGAGNVISGNTTAVEISNFNDNSHGNVIENNRIGTDATGAAAVPNHAGIRISSDNNIVRGNTIAFNGGTGVAIFAQATGNLVSQNSIVSNIVLGLDLSGAVLNDVPPASDPPDQDTGGNDAQNYPTLTSALPLGGGVQIQGTLASTPNSSFRIEFFANRERDELNLTLDGMIKRGMFAEGETYLGFVAATTNASGVATFTVNLPALPPDQEFITATATDVTNTGGSPRNNTSEFSPVYPLGGPSTVVTNTGDVGIGTLREAIFVANLTPGADTVTFNMSANDPRHFYYQNDGVAGRVSLANIAVTTATNDAAIAGIDPDWTHSWFSIQPAHDLPEITDTIAIDGYTQPGASANTLPEFQALNTVLKIELDGTHGAESGLRPQANGNAILNRFTGLAINRWASHGIELEGTTGNVVAGNFLGTDVSGTLDVGNGGFGVSIHDGEVASTIGGLNAADRNLISGNDSGGVNIFHSAGIVVQGNLIGPNRQRELTLGNRGSGVVIAESIMITIGGIDPGAGNVIARNSVDGVTVAATHPSASSQGDEPLAAKVIIVVPEECRVYLNELKKAIKGGDPRIIDVYRSNLEDCLSDFVEFQAEVIAATVTGCRFLGNGNSPGLAVDLGSDGVTPNDLGDDDLGANNLQNYPVLSSATTFGGATTIGGSLNSNSDASYRIEFYSNSVLDPSGYGEAENYLGFVNVTTDADGNAPLLFASPIVVPVGQFITSTATRLDDETLQPVETSELSRGIIVTAAGAMSADFDSDGDVDGHDFLAWQRGVGVATGATRAQGDANADGDVDAADLAAWKGDFDAVPAAAVTAPHTAHDSVPLDIDLRGMTLAAGSPSTVVRTINTSSVAMGPGRLATAHPFVAPSSRYMAECRPPSYQRSMDQFMSDRARSMLSGVSSPGDAAQIRAAVDCAFGLMDNFTMQFRFES